MGKASLERRRAKQQAAKAAKIQERDRFVAFHESGHAVGAWLLGYRSTVHYGKKGDPFLGECVPEGGLNSNLGLPAGTVSLTRDGKVYREDTGEVVLDDHGIFARRWAFFVLCGPQGQYLWDPKSMELDREESQESHFVEDDYFSHYDDACRWLSRLGIADDEVCETADRMSALALKMFKEPAIEACVHALAEQMIAKRSLTADEVQTILDTTYQKFGKAAAATAGQ